MHRSRLPLLQRVFELDVLACPRCGGRLRVLATIEEPTVVQKILTHVGLPTEPVTPRAPPPLPVSLWEPARSPARHRDHGAVRPPGPI